MKKWLSLLFLVPTIVLGQLKTVDLQYFSNVNIVRNPGFENGRIDWQASGGTYQLVTATNVGFGSASASWTPSAGSQTFKSTLAVITQGMQSSTQCSLSFYYKGSDANLNYKVVDQSSSTIAGPTTLSTSSGWTAQTLNFTCPGSGSLQVVFTSTAASAIIYLDQFQLGLSPDLGLITNANVSPTAAIAYSKLALSASLVNSDVSNSAAIAYAKLALASSILNSDISNSAGIVYSKLALSNSILNADINSAAAITYPKLALSNSILNADINSSAGIAYSKLALTGAILNGDLAGSIADGKLATSYLKADGTRALTAGWNAGNFGITANSFSATAGTGTIFMTGSTNTVNRLVGLVSTGDVQGLTIASNGAISILGSQTNDSGAAGTYGQPITSSVTTNTNFPTSGTTGDITSITLTAGDWDISGGVQSSANGATVTRVYFGVGTVTGNDQTGMVEGDNTFDAPIPLNAVRGAGGSIPSWRVSLSGSTTYYLKILGTYSIATPQYKGRISARRMR